MEKTPIGRIIVFIFAIAANMVIAVLAWSHREYATRAVEAFRQEGHGLRNLVVVAVWILVFVWCLKRPGRMRVVVANAVSAAAVLIVGRPLLAFGPLAIGFLMLVAFDAFLFDMMNGRRMLKSAPRLSVGRGGGKPTASPTTAHGVGERTRIRP